MGCWNDYDIWRTHDLRNGDFTKLQHEYFEDKATWICARCEDVGSRNGRKVAHMAIGKQVITTKSMRYTSTVAPRSRAQRRLMAWGP